MAYSLPEELVQEILVRLPPDEPVNLVHASLVCKVWRRVLSNRGCFLRRCREFYGSPPLLGYIRNRYHYSSPIGFVSATSAASPVRMPAADSCSGWRALDSRHGRVLILNTDGVPSKCLIVLDPITGSQQHLSMPALDYKSYPTPSRYYYAGRGAVLCAEENCCDHLDCHDGPFKVVIVQAGHDNSNIFTWASIYSSKTGAWSAPTSNHIKHHFWHQIYIPHHKRSFLIGDTLYFLFENGKGVIIKYDLRAHWLSEIDMPQDLPQDVYEACTLMMNEDGGLQVATLKNDCIYFWSRQDVTNGIGGWVQNRVMELGPLVPRRTSFEPYQLIGCVDGTNIIFINISDGVFLLDIESRKLRKFGETEYYMADHILPYVSFYAPRL